MVYFWKFMGWLILYSLMYFSVLDVLGLGPGKENRILSGVILLLSFPGWWFSWKWFEKTFGPRPVQAQSGGETHYFFALRNAPMTYYLMILKFFLLAMGANGIITLEHHEGSWRYFYIVNFIVLYLYAIPFLIIKTKNLKKALASNLILDNTSLALQQHGESIARVAFSDTQDVFVEQDAPGALIVSPTDKIYVGGRHAKGSSFYIPEAETIIQQIKQRARNSITPVIYIKEALKQAAFKPSV